MILIQLEIINGFIFQSKTSLQMFSIHFQLLISLKMTLSSTMEWLLPYSPPFFMRKKELGGFEEEIKLHTKEGSFLDNPQEDITIN